MSEKPERQRIVEEAIEWMVRLQSGDFSVAEGDALERWKALSSEHAEVFRQLLDSLAPLQDSPWRGQPSATVLRALEQPSSRRRFVGGALGLFVLLAGGAGLERWVQAGMGLPGELATGTGERRDWLLADGSRLRLNARSKARPLLDGAQRRLELRRGALRLEVKEDPRGAFALDCAAGRVDCASGSLLLAEERGAIRLVTLRGSARLTTGEGRQLAVAARRSLLFDAGGLLEQGPMQAGEDAWASGWLEVHDRSLAWVAEAFRPYLPGILQLDAEIAGNRVSGLFPLDDMPTSLDMLGRSLPIRVLRYSDYWISLRPA
ncbi:FecR family protein [Pseudomonas aeruginosa]|uniref:FecR family protein n=1 Tax=Pseudomonas aeruginosa TaxID=287 RepID=UPI00071B14D6|nr:FecR family protein [Pseudomonas aeruginosa]EJV1610236.1 FecR family protein [Pseudomonas aeruginosa]EKD1562644.1 FecR family protein [Pseudomonas aeruginosa]EKJ6945306.1 FecR family protein [Pseudomonas aeruginosa]EKM0354531.1 FecR family protein [Pseudomonas aeruginosa]EKQ2947436.1 FecR family protein [Pseudomonas aeruginosa]